MALSKVRIFMIQLFEAVSATFVNANKVLGMLTLINLKVFGIVRL